MWDEKSFSLTEEFEVVFLCGRIQLHHCAAFRDNLCCCAKADAVQDIIRVVTVVHALHPERDPQVFLLEHKSFHIHERLRNNTTKLLRDILLRLGGKRARTCIVIFTLIERRRSTPALEEKISSQVSWTFDGISNFNVVSLACASMLYTKSRESVAKTKPIIVNEDAELLVHRGEDRLSLRLFVLTLVLCEEIRRQLCHQIPDERRHLPAPNPVGAKPHGRAS